MPDFKHSDMGSIRCPYHNQRETFTAGSIIQPDDRNLVRYPCGYIEGLPGTNLGVPPLIPESQDLQDALTLRELSNRLRRLEERPYSRPSVPKIESRPAPTSQEPTILGTYGNDEAHR